MKLPSVLPVWVKPAARAVLCVLLLCGGWTLRGWHDAADRLAKVEADNARIADANAKAETANVALIAELRKPKAGVEIREVVRTNPSQCVLPVPVFDSLLHAVREANAAR